MNLRKLVGVIVLALTTLSLANLSLAQDGVTYDDILQGMADPTRWLTYSGDYSGKRHSPLSQITPDNVKRLVPIWTFQMVKGWG